MPPASSLRGTSPGATPSAATRWCPRSLRPWSSRTRWRMRGALPCRVACQYDMLQALFAVHASLGCSATCKPGALLADGDSHVMSLMPALPACQVLQQRVCLRRGRRPVLRGHALGAPGDRSPCVWQAVCSTLKHRLWLQGDARTQKEMLLAGGLGRAPPGHAVHCGYNSAQV